MIFRLLIFRMASSLYAEIHLNAKGHGDTIKERNITSDQQNAKTMKFLRRHLHDDLKNEYLTLKYPQVLCSSLKERCEHEKTIILPKARYEWTHMRLQDFKFVTAYNSIVFRITSQLKLCGEKVTEEDMMAKHILHFSCI